MDVREVEVEEAGALAPLLTDWRRLMLGEDEPACTADEAAHWFLPRPRRRRYAFIATDAEAAIGCARLNLRTDGSVPGFAPELFVVPEARRRGVGRALVTALADTTRSSGAPMLILRQDDGDEVGAAFADAIGAARGFRGLQNRCRMANVDPALLQAWVDRAAERAPGWSLIGWDGPCPDDLFDQFMEVQSAMHDAPVPVIAAVRRSADEIREVEAAEAALGMEHWVLAARHNATGVLGGFTEMAFERVQPWLGHQGDTGVVPAHRELGLGRWLKGAMALRIVAERSEVTQLETNTAEDNPAMRGINEAMGFRPAVVWQDRELPLSRG